MLLDYFHFPSSLKHCVSKAGCFRLQVHCQVCLLRRCLPTVVRLDESRILCYYFPHCHSLVYEGVLQVPGLSWEQNICLRFFLSSLLPALKYSPADFKQRILRFCDCWEYLWKWVYGIARRTVRDRSWIWGSFCKRPRRSSNRILVNKTKSC
jgi:hypothetical protein